MKILLGTMLFAGLYLITDMYLHSKYRRLRSSGKSFEKIAELIPMSVYEEKRLRHELERLDINISTKLFKAKALAPAIALSVIGLILLGAIPYIGAAFLILGIAVYYQKISSLSDKIKDKNDKIVRELPRFIRTFVHGMEYEKDVIAILEKYLRVAGAELKSELRILVSELKTENSERALKKFDAALGIPHMTSFISALIASMRGEDQRAVLRSITCEMKIMARENIREELEKRPRKVRAACLPMVISVLGMYLYVLGVNLIQSLNVIV